MPLPDTGRIHHLGAPPSVQPVHTPEGLAWTPAAAARLRELSQADLDDLLARLRDEMTAASERLEFEHAARLLAEFRQVEAHRATRDSG